MPQPKLKRTKLTSMTVTHQKLTSMTVTHQKLQTMLNTEDLT